MLGENIEANSVVDNRNPWQKMADEVRAEARLANMPKVIEASNNEDAGISIFSYYERDNIPVNQNGDLILDPNIGRFTRDEKGVRRLESCIFTTEEDAEFLRAAEKVELANGKKVNSELLKRCLTVDAYYSCAKRHMLEDNPQHGVISAQQLYLNGVNADVIREWRVDTRVCDSIRCKSDLVKGLIMLEQNGLLGELSDTERRRFDEFKKIASPDVFAEKLHGAQYKTVIDGKECVLPTDNIGRFLYLHPDKLREICLTDPDGKIGQLSKTEFAYAATEYLEDNKIIDNYALPNTIESRIKSLTSGQFIDFYAINKLNETQDTLHDKVSLNPELRSAILDQMPEDATTLEKAAYIYAKMCTILTYDNKYMAARQRGEAAEKHKSLDYVEQISPDNNEVVCFEFNIMYAKMLSELGLNFRSKYEGMDGENYGDGHASLEFREGNFIVGADSVSSILGGDIAKAKLGLPLTGLRCENKNKRTQQEFQEVVSRMYELVQQQTQGESWLSKYDLSTENLKPVEFSEKRAILLERLEGTNLRGIDVMTYVLQLRKVLFNETEREDNVVVTILRNNDVVGQGPKLETGAVIAINDTGFNEQPDGTNYYYLSSDRKLSSLTLEDIKAKFNNGIFEYIDEEDPKIPGVISSIGK